MPDAPGAQLEIIQGGAHETNPEPVPQLAVSRQTIGDFIVPSGYEVWGDGTYRVEDPPEDEEEGRREPSLNATPTSRRRRGLRPVTRRPLWIRQFGHTIDTGEELIQLAFYDTFGSSVPRMEWVTRVQLADQRQLTPLSQVGLPVRAGNARAVEDYLDRALYENAQVLPRVRMGSRTGAYQLDEQDGGQSGWGWLLGSAWVGPHGTCVEPDPRRAGVGDTNGYAISGDEGSWFAQLRNVSAYGPVPRWLCFSTFAAPLLRFIRHRTFIVHHWGDTGTGKTACMKFAMSAWGDPHALTATFNRTEKSFTELFSYVDDLPVAFDELQASKNDDHASIIYALCLERGRGRARRQGGLLKEIGNWRSVVRMTGEEPIIGNGRVDLGGQSTRVLQLNAEALTPSQGERIHQWMDHRNFGWGGLRFLEALRDILHDPHGADRLIAKHTELRDRIAQAVPEMRSRSSALAAVALAQLIATQRFFQVPKDAAMHGAVEDAAHVATLIARDESDRTTVAERTLQVFRDHREAYRKRWIDVSTPGGARALEHKTYQELFGVERAGTANHEVWLVGTEANKLLKKEGIPPGRAWVDLRRAGTLVTEGKGRLATLRKRGAFRNRVYVLRQADFDFNEDD